MAGCLLHNMVLDDLLPTKCADRCISPLDSPALIAKPKLLDR